MYVSTPAVVQTPKGETIYFKINTGVLQGNPIPVVIILDYILRTANDEKDKLSTDVNAPEIQPAISLIWIMLMKSLYSVARCKNFYFKN